MLKKKNMTLIIGVILVVVIVFVFTVCDNGNDGTNDPCANGHTPNLETGKCTISDCEALTYVIGNTGPGGGIIYYRNEAGFTVQAGIGFSEYKAHYLEIMVIPLLGRWCNCAEGTGCLETGVTNMTYVDGTLNGGSVNGWEKLTDDEWIAINADIGNGRKNTSLIANCIHHSDNTKNNNAAIACLAIADEKNDWFLPSIGELCWLFRNISEIRTSDLILYDPYQSLVSSSQYSYPDWLEFNYAWNMKYNSIWFTRKDGLSWFRGVRAF